MLRAISPIKEVLASRSMGEGTAGSDCCGDGYILYDFAPVGVVDLSQFAERP